MPERLEPVRIPVPGGKVIEELAGKVSTKHPNYSVAHMMAPPDWAEPAQRPEFDEVTYVLNGELLVHHDGSAESFTAGQAVLCRAGDRISYTAGPDGAEYLALCVPAFSDDTVHRDA